MVVVLSADVKLLTLGVVPFNAVTVMLPSSNAQLVGGVDLAICWQASRAARRLGLGSFWARPRSLAFASGHALDKEWRAYEMASAHGVSQVKLTDVIACRSLSVVESHVLLVSVHVLVVPFRAVVFVKVGRG